MIADDFADEYQIDFFPKYPTPICFSCLSADDKEDVRQNKLLCKTEDAKWLYGKSMV